MPSCYHTMYTHIALNKSLYIAVKTNCACINDDAIRKSHGIVTNDEHNTAQFFDDSYLEMNSLIS